MKYNVHTDRSSNDGVLDIRRTLSDACTTIPTDSFTSAQREALKLYITCVSS